VTCVDEITVRHLLQSCQELIKRFAEIKVSGIRPIAYDKVLHRLASGDASLTVFQTVEELFMPIIGVWHAGHAKAREQAPPAMAHAALDVCSDFRIRWVILSLFQQAIQIVLDSLFGLRGRPRWLVLRFGRIQ